MRNEKRFDFTVVEGFAGVLEVLEGKRQATKIDIEFIMDRIEKQKRKATSSKKADKIENIEILDIIIEELRKNKDGLTISELLKTDNIKNYTYEEKVRGKIENKEVTSSKVSAILQKEIYIKDEEGKKIENIDSRIVRIEDGKKIIFKLK